MFGDMDVWKNVNVRDRGELYDDVLHQLAKKEKASFCGLYIYIYILMVTFR